MTTDQNALDKDLRADKNRKHFLVETVLETPTEIRDAYVKNWEKRMRDIQRWVTIMQASKEPEHFIDLIDGLDGDDSFKFCEALQDIAEDVAIDELFMEQRHFLDQKGE